MGAAEVLLRLHWRRPLGLLSVRMYLQHQLRRCQWSRGGLSEVLEAVPVLLPGRTQAAVVPFGGGHLRCEVGIQGRKTDSARSYATQKQAEGLLGRNVEQEAGELGTNAGPLMVERMPEDDTVAGDVGDGRKVTEGQTMPGMDAVVDRTGDAGCIVAAAGVTCVDMHRRSTSVTSCSTVLRMIFSKSRHRSCQASVDAEAGLQQMPPVPDCACPDPAEVVVACLTEPQTVMLQPEMKAMLR